MKFHHAPAPPISGMDPQRRSYAPQRLRHFGLTMIVMGVSFFLYYLGLFGRIEGPLNPAQLGVQLAVGGVTKAHVLITATGLTLLTVTWNWLYNLAGFLLGARRTCSRIDDRGHVCRQPAGRRRTMRAKGGQSRTRYVCAVGHSQTHAHFHALKKGTIGHMLWVIALIFTVIVFYATYC